MSEQNKKYLVELSKKITKDYLAGASTDWTKRSLAKETGRKLFNRSQGVKRAFNKPVPNYKQQYGGGSTDTNPIGEDNAAASSSWGGWWGGFPGSGTAMKGLKAGTDEPSKFPQRNKYNSKEFAIRHPLIKLSGETTSVIFSPTLQQTAHKLAISDLTTKGEPTKTVKQVKEAQQQLYEGRVLRFVGRVLRNAVIGKKSKTTIFGNPRRNIKGRAKVSAATKPEKPRPWGEPAPVKSGPTGVKLPLKPKTAKPTSFSNWHPAAARIAGHEVDTNAFSPRARAQIAQALGKAAVTNNKKTK